jgi:hypothetical protein
MKLLLATAAKAPKWVFAAAVIGISTLVFVIWMLNRGAGDGGTKPVVEAVAAPAFEIQDVVLCGNTLVNFKTGEIIAKQWLEGFGDNPPNITKVLPKEQLVIVTGHNGAVGAFGFDGKTKPVLKADEKPLGAAGFNPSCSEVVYVRDGDLWHGRVDWVEGKVNSPRRITETGYFRPDTFRSRWLWHEGDLLVPVLGKTLQVGLSTGSVKEVPVNLGQLEHGMSPLGTFAVVPVGGRELGVVDLLNGETKKFNVGQRIRKFLWLTPTKVAIHIGNNQVAQYDHALKKLEGPQQSSEGIRDIAAPSPDGSCFLTVGSGLTVLDLAEKKDSKLKLLFTTLEWVSNDELLCSCDAIDTDQRGVWLVKKSGEMERLSNQPIDSVRGGGGNAGPLIRIPGGALFVSKGSLWSFDAGTKTVKQVTINEMFKPMLLQLTTAP